MSSGKHWTPVLRFLLLEPGVLEPGVLEPGVLEPGVLERRVQGRSVEERRFSAAKSEEIRGLQPQWP
jgi:hypothetical protein